jgi:hypothetical protein
MSVTTSMIVCHWHLPKDRSSPARNSTAFPSKTRFNIIYKFIYIWSYSFKSLTTPVEYINILLTYLPSHLPYHKKTAIYCTYKYIITLTAHTTIHVTRCRISCVLLLHYIKSRVRIAQSERRRGQSLDNRGNVTPFPARAREFSLFQSNQVDKTIQPHLSPPYAFRRCTRVTVILYVIYSSLRKML